MASVNKVILVGNVGKNPEIRNTGDGKKVASLSVATSEYWKDKNGERQEKTNWHRVVIFNQGLADIAEKYVKKGSKIYVEGSLQTRKWTDNNGQERYSTEVVLSAYNGSLVLLDGRNHNDVTEEPDGYSEGIKNRTLDEYLNDDIPF